ncbi:MAG: MBL fold metallo-hydrolase [Pseudomonadota bacterium]
MSLTATILGCGSSGGVPRIGNDWGACDPGNPKNRRRRCSLLVERKGPDGVTRVLVDTSPDLREQLLDTGVDSLDGVLYTHDHADHTHGIDDLRVLALMLQRRIDVYHDARTGAGLRERFGYCFQSPPGSLYPPILTAHEIDPSDPVIIDGAGGPIVAQPIVQVHGDILSLGFRFGDLVYSCDLSDIPETSLPWLRGVDLWIVDALRYKPHVSHFSVDDALHWIQRIAPQRAILTNMHVDLDYEELSARLPDAVIPAHDGLRVVIDHD